MISSSVNQANSSSDSYTDLSSLNAIRDLGRQDKNQALGEVAKQFESMMVRMMMKSMRQANEVFAEGNMLSSHEGDMYQQMFDDQMALNLTQGQGFGIAEVMVRQLQQRYGDEEKATQATGPLSEYRGAQQSGNNQPLSAADQLRVTPAPAPAEAKAKAKAKAMQDSSVTSPASPAFDFDGSSEKFVEQLYAMAEKSAQKIGQTAEVLLAQAALETGWGQKITGLGDMSSFNLFNIKADSRWQGSSLSVPTLEVRNGTAVREVASFRAYQSPQQSFDDYVDFISNSPRYEKALQADGGEEYIRALSEAGYATDPDYSSKIMRIINSQQIQPQASSSPLAAVES
jgi:flagellar protein FlgJ